jgi:hypothetical protein
LTDWQFEKEVSAPVGVIYLYKKTDPVLWNARVEGKGVSEGLPL